MALVVPSSAVPAPTAVRLHLDDDGRYFAYGNTLQPLSEGKQGCEIASPEPLIDLSSAPGGSSPGIGADNIGVKRSKSSANGTPCAQVDGTETLTIARQTGPQAVLPDRRFKALRLDLEMTGDAVVRLTFGGGTSSPTYLLQTGNNIATAEVAELDTQAPYFVSSGPGDLTDGCASPNSSGPNSGPSDNCQWSVNPGFAFDSFTLTALSGTVSLEGGGDFANPADFETLLYLDNQPPTAVADTFSTAEDTALTAGNVLSNDSDPDGGSLTASVVSGPSHGALVLNSNGTFTYTPQLNYFGPDAFTYAASDGVASSNAIASITVTAVNDPPVPATAGATTNEDSSVVVTVATDVDSSDGSATCTLEDSGGNTLAGTVVNGAGFTVTVTPPLNFFGTMTLTCTVTDAEGATSTTQTIITVGVTSVNDAPVAVDDVADVDQDVSSTSDSSVDIDVVANDLDVEGDALTPVSISDVLPAGATAVANAGGGVTYTPPEGYVGAGSFTYRASDGQASSASPATVNVTVYAVMCSGDTVTDADGGVSGSFTRLSDLDQCKRYTVDADATAGTVLFAPTGLTTVKYRGYVVLGAEDAPPVGGDGEYGLLLRYDPAGGTTYRPVPWCIAPQFDPDGVLTGATLPGTDTWCVASAAIKAVGADPDLVTEWQVYGEDDPRFTR